MERRGGVTDKTNERKVQQGLLGREWGRWKREEQDNTDTCLLFLEEGCQQGQCILTVQIEARVLDGMDDVISCHVTSHGLQLF